MQNYSKTLSTRGSISNRETEWYLYNKNLLFATHSEDANHLWINKLSDLLYSYSTPTAAHYLNSMHQTNFMKIQELQMPEPGCQQRIRQNSNKLTRLEEFAEEEESSG